MKTQQEKRKKGKGKTLRSFFAVTLSSVYQVVISGNKDVPYLKKIVGRDNTSSIEVGGRIDNGSMVSVGVQLVMFVPEGHSLASPVTSYVRELAEVNTQWWGGHTSLVVALFLKKEAAITCSGQSDLSGNDPRWLEQTIEVLRAIGDEHPYCSISDYSDLRLIPKDKWVEH